MRPDPLERPLQQLPTTARRARSCKRRLQAKLPVASSLSRPGGRKLPLLDGDGDGDGDDPWRATHWQQQSALDQHERSGHTKDTDRHRKHRHGSQRNAQLRRRSIERRRWPSSRNRLGRIRLRSCLPKTRMLQGGGAGLVLRPARTGSGFIDLVSGSTSAERGIRLQDWPCVASARAVDDTSRVQDTLGILGSTTGVPSRARSAVSGDQTRWRDHMLSATLFSIRCAVNLDTRVWSRLSARLCDQSASPPPSSSLQCLARNDRGCCEVKIYIHGGAVHSADRLEMLRSIMSLECVSTRL